MGHSTASERAAGRNQNRLNSLAIVSQATAIERIRALIQTGANAFTVQPTSGQIDSEADDITASLKGPIAQSLNRLVTVSDGLPIIASGAVPAPGGGGLVFTSPLSYGPLANPVNIEYTPIAGTVHEMWLGRIFRTGFGGAAGSVSLGGIFPTVIGSYGIWAMGPLNPASMVATTPAVLYDQIQMIAIVRDLVTGVLTIGSSIQFAIQT